MSQFNISQIMGQSIYVVKNCCPEQFHDFIKRNFFERPCLIYRQDGDKSFYSLYLGDFELQSKMFPYDNSSECISQFSECAVLLARLISDEQPF